MLPDKIDIVGRWSEDLGHTNDLSRDTVLNFCADGGLKIVSGSECIIGHWDCPIPGRLLMQNENGHCYGPFQIRIERRKLPLGEFDVLESDGAILPFGRRRFTRMVEHDEPSDAPQPRNEAF
jgi:hypothetical protein